jgi:bifunctional UDP-N-acetylglucosamine pyrophosphorylase / glucosamine-1-phosphate N-acetyltransferase
MSKKKNHILILAAGKGTRMGVPHPKVLVEINGKPIFRNLADELSKAFPDISIIVGHEGQKVIDKIGNKFNYIWQKEQLGTGHAVLSAKDYLEKKEFENIMVIPGDHPLITTETLMKLAEEHSQENAALSLAVVKVPDFLGDNESFWNCGRIIRNQKGGIEAIVELKDADETQKNIQEVNVSYYCFNAEWLWENIEKLGNENNAQEYYLTDLIKIAKEQGEKIHTVVIENSREGFGINTEKQLSIVSKYFE